jgi:hypothetical protein
VHDPLLVRLLDEARLAESSRDDDHRRALEGVAAASATFAGALVDLGEAGTPVVVRTRGGRVARAQVSLVGGDFVVLQGEGGQLWCRLAAIVSVRVPSGTPVATGDRDGVDVLLVDALALLADDRPRVTLDAGAGSGTSGELVAAGADVVTLRLDGGDSLYVPSSSVDAVLRSG